MDVYAEEKLQIYENKFSKNTQKTIPRTMAEGMWGGALQLKDAPCGISPLHCCAPVLNTYGQRHLT